MRPGLTVVALLLGLIAASCGQVAPERGALPAVPESLDFPTPTTTLVPADGACVVTDGMGVLINEFLAGYSAAGVLEAGDVIVGIDGVDVANQSDLRSVMRGKVPGSEIDITYERGGTLATASVQLGVDPEDADRAMIGVMVRDDFAVTAASEIDQGIIEPGRLIVEFDDATYSVDIVENRWSRLPIEVPASQVVEVDGRFFAVTPDFDGITAIDSTESFTFGTPGFLVVAPLGAFGSQLVYAVVEPDEAGGVMSSAVVASDLGSGQITWSNQPPAVEGVFPVPISGFVNPSGTQVVVTHNHADGRVHTLYGADGSLLAGWGSDGGPEFAPPGSLVAGWLSDDRLVVIVINEQDTFQAVILDPSDTSLPTESLVLSGVNEIASAHAVAGTSLLVIATNTETYVFDAASLTFDIVTRNCGAEVLGRAS